MADNCSGAYATAEDYVETWRLHGVVQLDDPDQRGEIEDALLFSSATIASAVAAQNACDCSLPTWAQNYLKRLNVIDAAVVQKISCAPALSDSLRETYLNWLDAEYTRIRDFDIDLCGGTGKNFPAFGSLQVTHTEFDAAQQVINEMLKNS